VTATDSPGTSPPSLADRARLWRKRIEDGRIEFSDVVRLKNWQTLAGAADQDDRALGNLFYEAALEKFEEKHPDVHGYQLNKAIFGASGTGVYLTPEGRLWYTVIEKAIGFDWSEGLLLVSKLNALWKQSKAWWPTVRQVAPAEGSRPTGMHLVKKLRWALKNRRSERLEARARDVEEERRPHLERIYDLCSAVLSAVNTETVERRTSEPSSRAPSDAFLKRIKVLSPEVASTEADIRKAADRYAQLLYGKGMLWGLVALGGLCAIVGLAFVIWDADAWNAIALLGGGLGAVVSVLQRMTSGHLKLDYEAGPKIVSMLGAGRPLIGAIIGMAIFALVEGGWAAIDVKSHVPLAFFAGLGFLAGFNERFAQDMLVGSAKKPKT
jgi:hypothetical protein